MIQQGRTTTLWAQVALSALLVAGCGSKSKPAHDVHTYNGTASVGDYIVITIDRTAQTISWTNKTNAQNGNASYTVDGTGAFVVSGGVPFTRGYEIPGVAVVAAAQNTGPSGDRQSPAFFWEQVSSSRTEFKNMTANMIQFRPEGAWEMGCGSIAADGSNMSRSAYMPEEYLTSGSPAFVIGETLPIYYSVPANTNFDGVVLTDNPDGTIQFQPYKTSKGGPDGAPGVLFKAGDSWAIDGLGSIFVLDSPATKEWQATNAGTYHLLGWGVNGLSLTSAGTGAFLKTTLTVDSAGTATIADPAGGTKVVNLVPFADDTDVAGTGKVDLPCNGLFTNGSGSPDDKIIFGFVGQTIFFGGVKMKAGPSQEFVYGVALKQ